MANPEHRLARLVSILFHLVPVMAVATVVAARRGHARCWRNQASVRSQASFAAASS